jgi:hypothetical protein
MREKPTNNNDYWFGLLIMYRSSCMFRHKTPIHNILSTVAQLSISQKALGTLPEDGNVMPKHVGAVNTFHLGML